MKISLCIFCKGTNLEIPLKEKTIIKPKIKATKPFMRYLKKKLVVLDLFFKDKVKARFLAKRFIRALTNPQKTITKGKRGKYSKPK